MERLISYLRLSKEDDSSDDESNSISNQRILIERYIRADKELSGMELVEVSDDGYSGKNMERPGMTRLLKMIKDKQVSCIVVKDFSRFSRDYLELGKYIEQIFPFMGIRFIAINDNYDSRNYAGGIGEIDVAFKELLYDFYSEDLSGKVKTVLKSRRQSGKFIAVLPPYGFIKDRNNKHKLVIDEEAADIVKEIYEEYNDGTSMYAIAQNLNEREVTAPGKYLKEITNIDFSNKGQVKDFWDVTAVSRILHREEYNGTHVFGKSRSLEVGSKKKVNLPEEEWQRVRDVHPKIIDDELFNQVQEKLSKKKRGRINAEGHMLKGKVICGGCGNKMQHSKKGKPKYECIKKYYIENPEECVTSIRDEDLEEVILKLLQNNIKHEGDLAEVVRKNAARAQEHVKKAEERLDKMIKSCDGFEERIMEGYESYREGMLDKETYLMQKDMYDRMISELEEKIEKQREAVNKLRADAKCPPGYDSERNTFKITELNKDVADLFIDHITVYKDNSMEIKWKFNM